MQVAGSGQAQTADACSTNATLSDADVAVESGRESGSSNFLEVPQPARSSPAAAEEICRWESMAAERMVALIERVALPCVEKMRGKAGENSGM